MTEDRADTPECKQEAKALKKANKAPKKVSLSYRHMVMGGVSLFFQGLIQCIQGYFWAGGFLLPLGALCWIRSRPRVFEFCLAIVGAVICVYEACSRLYSVTSNVIWASNGYEDASTDTWISGFVFDILGCIFAFIGLVAFPLALSKHPQIKSEEASRNQQQTTAPLGPMNAGDQMRTAPSPMPTPVMQPAPMHTPGMQPEMRPPLQAAQLITQPYGQPQPILVTGNAQAFPGQPGILHPAGIAYVAYPPNSNRDAIPIQPLTGQPILAGQPILCTPPCGPHPPPQYGPHPPPQYGPHPPPQYGPHPPPQYGPHPPPQYGPHPPPPQPGQRPCA
eukprot:Gregarina_sp_Poly_1__3945@NODE_2186_length_2518_cov_180_035088_g1408_i0_p1_GENE_NODE_2186_length_2518_cov_180_035088_g1408_i0NODE_2186_length_2518_cov_180_035088_g1408_i0_p1_ORF_typecomplete_len334_score34_91Dicty_CAR/PF05462_11/0_034_NODE_2186_length_2518_cov_180_035088_g1408_i02661267